MAQDVPRLVDHLFRREAGKMAAYLVRAFGPARLELAEDVVQDVLCRALELWPARGVPENPSAWLMRAARNRAVDILRRDGRLSFFAPEIESLIMNAEAASKDAAGAAALEREIQDDELRLMFSCCRPEISPEAQVALILKTLCGFSVSEIAQALLAEEGAVEKRLGRARAAFRDAGELEPLRAAQIPERLEAVHQAIYLLFSEGYHGSGSDQVVREDLCFEALRLVLLLAEHPGAAKPRTFALAALFCFGAARLSGRAGAAGLLPLEEQDRSAWDRSLIARGFDFLERSAAGRELSDYHLEAAIAALHSSAPNAEETDWREILGLYDRLLLVKPTPVVALNRAVAAGRALGPEKGLAELGAIVGAEKLKGYSFYPAARGELLRQTGRPAEAQKCFRQAAALARTKPEAEFFARRASECHAAARGIRP